MGILDLMRPRRAYVRTVYVSSSVKGMSASDLYNTQPALRSVISFLADNVAGLPLKCYVRKPDGSRERDRDSVLAKVLQRPNDWTTGHELIRATVSEYLLHDDGAVLRQGAVHLDVGRHIGLGTPFLEFGQCDGNGTQSPRPTICDLLGGVPTAAHPHRQRLRRSRRYFPSR